MIGKATIQLPLQGVRTVLYCTMLTFALRHTCYVTLPWWPSVWMVQPVRCWCCVHCSVRACTSHTCYVMLVAQCAGGAAGEALGSGSPRMYAHLAGQQGGPDSSACETCCCGVR